MMIIQLFLNRNLKIKQFIQLILLFLMLLGCVTRLIKTIIEAVEQYLIKGKGN